MAANPRREVFFETDFLVPEIKRLAPAAYEVNGFFLDIGVPEDLDRAQTELAGLSSPGAPVYLDLP